MPPALLLLFSLAEAEPALLLPPRPFGDARCARSALRASAGAGGPAGPSCRRRFFSGRFRACRRTRLGFSRPDGRRGASTAGLKSRPRHADRSHCQTLPSFGSAPKVWRHTSRRPPPPARTRPPRRGPGKPDSQPRIAAFHMKLSSLNIGLARSADNPRRQVTDGPGRDAPPTAPGLPTGLCFRSAL